MPDCDLHCSFAHKMQCWCCGPVADVVGADLQDIMKGIYKACKDASKEYDTTLQAGANIAGFLKVAEAMVAQGM